MTSFSFKPAALKFALPAVALAMSVSAHASTVTFTTTGYFTCTVACTGNGTSTVTFGSGADTVTLNFTGVTDKKANLAGTPVPFSNVPGGKFNTTESAGEMTDDTSIPLGAVFNLTVTQNTPAASPSSGSLAGNVEGSIADDTSDAAVQFPVGSTKLVIGGNIYNLQQQSQTDNNNAPGYDLEAPDGGTGSTTLQMNIQGTALPEPTFLALTGVGFAGLSLLAYRRRKSA